jgi:hypothetical protein
MLSRLVVDDRNLGPISQRGETNVRNSGQILFLAICGLFAVALPALAHHSFTAEFDIYKPVVIEGTVTKLDWINPHIQIYLDAKDGSGNSAPWQIESWGTGNMRRAGVPREKLAIGTPVKIRAYHAKDGTKNFAYLRNITFTKDGSEFELWVGGAEGTPDQQR